MIVLLKYGLDPRVPWLRGLSLLAKKEHLKGLLVLFCERGYVDDFYRFDIVEVDYPRLEKKTTNYFIMKTLPYSKDVCIKEDFINLEH